MSQEFSAGGKEFIELETICKGRRCVVKLLLIRRHSVSVNIAYHLKLFMEANVVFSSSETYTD